mmetsp:Transcript_72622/g.158548  ORF Transcript_72622/g.158548 Transcript_72622/m.158548 type:complete len:204 (-) Transcript_72622:39-650(-)
MLRCWPTASRLLGSLDDLVDQGGAQLGPGSVPLGVLGGSHQLRQNLGSTVLVQSRGRDALDCGDLAGAAAAAIGGVVVEQEAIGDEVVLGLLSVADGDDTSLQLRDNEGVVVGDGEGTLGSRHGDAVDWFLDSDGLRRSAERQEQPVLDTSRLGESESTGQSESHISKLKGKSSTTSSSTVGRLRSKSSTTSSSTGRASDGRA